MVVGAATCTANRQVKAPASQQGVSTAQAVPRRCLKCLCRLILISPPLITTTMKMPLGFFAAWLTVLNVRLGDAGRKSVDRAGAITCGGGDGDTLPPH